MLQHPLEAFGETAKKPCYFPRHPEPQAAKHKQAKLILRAFIVRTRCGRDLCNVLQVGCRIC